MTQKRTALIVGAGSGLSASLARRCSAEGLAVALAARDTAKLAALTAETGAVAHTCDASDRAGVDGLFAALDAAGAGLDLVIYNASGRVRGPIIDLDPQAVERSLAITAFGAFLVAQAAARRMLAQGHGTILLTGASAGVKGYARSAPFAMGKFALRGLAQSMARELHPQNIHVAHAVIDGGIAREGDPRVAERQAERGDDAMLSPDAIAEAYWQLHRQHRSAWSWEIELRPWVETF